MLSLFSTPPPNPAAEQHALLALAMVPGIGPHRLRALIAHFGSAEAVLHAPARVLQRIDGIGPQTARAIAGFADHAAVERQREQAMQLGAILVPAWSPHFPALLRQIYDPPAFLWVRGNIEALAQPSLAIVGTRRATDYGRRVAFEFAQAFVRRGFCVVSGLAYGIDAEAHQGTVDAGGATVAVLGTGVDRVYPARHARLSEQIRQRGALVSEYPLGTPPDAVNFPRRNRVISGLTHGTLVVEAFETGGALITARLALEHNREVFAIPGRIHSKAGLGSNRLIQQGHAKLVLTPDDVFDELNLPTASATAQAKQHTDPRPAPTNLSAIEQRLYDALTETPQHIDHLCHHTGLDPSSALVYLLSLEFKGHIRQMAGKQFMRA